MDASHPRERSERLMELSRSLRSARERSSALLDLLRSPVTDRKSLFGELVALASAGHRDIGLVRDVILSLPRDWVVAHIEEYSDPVLGSGDWEAFRRYAELFRQLGDRGLLSRLRDAAQQRTDYDIKEVADDITTWLDSD